MHQAETCSARLGEIYILVQYVHLLLLSDGNTCGSYSGACTVPLMEDTVAPAMYHYDLSILVTVAPAVYQYDVSMDDTVPPALHH